MDTNLRSAFTDVVVLAIISNGFWLLVLGICVAVFRREIRTLLDSVSTFSVAGSRVELGNRKQTLKSYAILANVLLDAACDTETNVKMAELFSEVHAQQLVKFCWEYMKEVPKEEWNPTLLRNIAYIAQRKGQRTDSVALYEFLLEKRPDDPILRNDYGYLLLLTNPSRAKEEYDKLVKEYPGDAYYKCFRAQANIKLKEFDAAATDLRIVIEAGVIEDYIPEMIEELRAHKPKEGAELEQAYSELVASPHKRNRDSGVPVTPGKP